MIRRILLVNAPFADRKRQRVYSRFSLPPDGLLALSAFLRMHGRETQVIDMVLEPMTPQQVRRCLLATRPDLIGVSAITPTFPAAQRICRLAKETLGQVVTVVGGAHAYAPAEELLAEPAIDFAVRGDGEGTLIELIEALDHPGALSLRHIPGLMYREGGQVRDQTPRALTQPLDVLPLVDRDAVPLHLYGEPFTVAGSRGCPGRCVFCVSAIQPHRLRDVDNTFAEIYWLYTCHGARMLYLADNVLTRIERLCDLLENGCPDLKWSCECRVDTVNGQLLGRMRRAGCVMIEFGVESGNQAILDRMRKNISLDDVRRAVREARAAGIEVACTYIIGHHCDTRETMRDTLNLIRELGQTYQAKALLSFNTLFPGTYQAVNRESLGLTLDNTDCALIDPNVPNINGPNFTSDDLRELYFEVIDWVDQSFPV